MQHPRPPQTCRSTGLYPKCSAVTIALCFNKPSWWFGCGLSTTNHGLAEQVGRLVELQIRIQQVWGGGPEGFQ